jgi:hypothetical protein
MNGKKFLLKAAGVCIICLLIAMSVLPSALGNPSSNAEYNIAVLIKPLRKVFPRIIHGNGQPIGFMTTATNEGPGAAPGFPLKFEIIRHFSTETYEYNTTYDVQPLDSNTGMGYIFTTCTLIGQRVAVYEARVSVDLQDTVSGDNTASYYFITLNL